MQDSFSYKLFKIKDQKLYKKKCGAYLWTRQEKIIKINLIRVLSINTTG